MAGIPLREAQRSRLLAQILQTPTATQQTFNSPLGTGYALLGEALKSMGAMKGFEQLDDKEKQRQHALSVALSRMGEGDLKGAMDPLAASGNEGLAAQIGLSQAMPPPKEAPKTRKREAGDEFVIEQWNPQTGGWDEVSRAPRYKPAGTTITVGGEGDPRPKPPAGYMYVSPDPNVMDLKAIPGGPADRISGDAAGRVQAVETGLKAVESVEGLLFKEDGSPNAAMVARLSGPKALLTGDARTVFNGLRTGVQAQIRAESGAQVTEEETNSFLERLLPNVMDLTSPGLVQFKINLLKDFLQGYGRQIRPDKDDPIGGLNTWADEQLKQYEDPLGIK